VKSRSKGVVFKIDIAAGPTKLVTYLYDKTAKRMERISLRWKLFKRNFQRQQEISHEEIFNRNTLFSICNDTVHCECYGHLRQPKWFGYE